MGSRSSEKGLLGLVLNFGTTELQWEAVRSRESSQGLEV
jgi:hypothetical protein